MRRYRYKRNYEWSPAIAYSVGLIASDGCLARDGRHVDLTSVDIEQLENFCVAVGIVPQVYIKPKVPWKEGDVGRPAYRVQVSDVAYYDFLLRCGLTPRKSTTIGRISVPARYWAHFLRGVFDGDGSVYGYYDKRWRSSFMFYWTIASASQSFLEFVRTTNSRLLGVGPGTLRVSGKIYILSYAKYDTRILSVHLYKDSGMFSLSRKKEKLNTFLKQAGYSTI